MNTFKVEYMPALLSPNAFAVIKQNINPSMIASDESTGQYELDTILELEDLFKEQDLKILKNLKEKYNIHYIEI
jgi:hypothetical protein